MMKPVRDLITSEAAGGMALLVVAALAMLAANSGFAPYYDNLFTYPLPWGSLGFLINDGLMAVFFLTVGLEIKHELAEGELASRSQAILPLGAALGGVITPAVIFALINWDTTNLHGWAIPAATDIAFSLGVLALVGKGIAPALRIFLLSVAVIDDVAAVLIIALFYTDHLVLLPLLEALALVVALWLFPRFRIMSLPVYILLGVMLWLALLHSGVHPTVAGVAFGLLLPLPLGKRLGKILKPWVTFMILPLFAFANAGVPLAGLSLDHYVNPLPLGIALGLFFGKQIGIFTASWWLVRWRLATFPAGASWLEFYAVCIIAGIGFTMSLFIGGLAFRDPAQMLYTRLGVITGSLFSAMVGYAALRIAVRRKMRS